MNLKQLTKQVGTNLRLRPLPIRVDSNGTQLPESDDHWRLEAILDDPNRVRLVNIHTDHIVELQPDNVREFRSPDFLLLRCHLIISGLTVRIEPIIQQAQAPTAVRSGSATIQLRGDPLRLLVYCIQREEARLFDYAEADDAMAALDLTPDRYKDAAEELGDLGLVTVHPNGNHPSGIGRTVLRPEIFLAAGQLSLSGPDLRNELEQLFDFLRKVPRDQFRIRVPDLLERKIMPLPRLDLVLRGLEDMGYVIGHGPGHYDWGSSLDIEITPRGRRMLRGDEPFPY